MSIKINKNGKEYDLGFVPQQLYDDVEDLKEKKAEIELFHDTITASDTNIHYLFIDKPRTGDCKCIIPIPFALGANANEYLNVWIQGFNVSNTQALIRYQAPTSGTFDLYLAFVY